MDSTSSTELPENPFKVRTKGATKVEWKDETVQTYNPRYHRAEEENFRLETVLLRESRIGDNVIIEAGYHTYPFSFLLPHNIPSSFECFGGSVRYTIKAIMDRPWKLNHQTRLVFTIEAPFDLNEVPAARSNMSEGGEEFFFGFPCLGPGSMKYNFYLPASDFGVGEPVEATFKIDNNSRIVDVVKLELTLQQNVRVRASTQTKTLQKAIRTAQQFGPFGRKVEATLRRKIPAVPLSNLKNCGIIDIQYRLDFHVGVSGCRSVTNLQQKEHKARGLDEITADRRASNESNVPSAQIISKTVLSPSRKIPFPVPVTDHRFPNPTSIPPYPMPMNNELFESANPLGATNQPYPPQMASAPFDSFDSH
ncbi:arrestin domain-containing protein 2-like [Venturia canescens]|uniref:arrestin domain-containing protein 2-like n=1 Tax=Venturia canescens TaxID=32260 RepID=UPI001C9C4E92|nr:arrestin domain-containing protein 2-like [Venturia canescens]